MKKTKLILALCLAGCMGYAQLPPRFLYHMINTIAGDGAAGFSGDGGFAVNAALNYPNHVFVDASGNIYIGDTQNNRIRKITKTGIISTFAGNGTLGFSGDGGQATAAEFHAPSSMTLDASGNLYVADTWNQRIRKINTSGVINTIAGNGSAGYSGDGGQATAAELNYPWGVTIDALGNLYISDQVNNRIRKVATTGIISTIAGYTTTGGYSGDGGQATAAGLNDPDGVCFDASGNMYIADSGNNRIRMVNTSGIISTFAGNGTNGYTGDGGAATAAELGEPTDVKIDAAGTIYIVNYQYSSVRTITSGIINQFVGYATQGFTGDCGAATSAELHLGQGIALDASANLYIADQANQRIRYVSIYAIANAGPNQVNVQTCCGYPGVTIGTPGYSCLSYTWSPSTALSCTNCAQPTCSYTNTSTPIIYTVTVNDPGISLSTNTSTVQVTAQSCGCGGCCRIAKPSIDGSSGIVLPTNFSVYPNPSDNNITIGLYGLAEYIRIIDMQGRTIYEVQNTNAGEFNLDISQYTKGIYFVMAKIGDVIEKQKLVVE